MHRRGSEREKEREKNWFAVRYLYQLPTSAETNIILFIVLLISRSKRARDVLGIFKCF